MHHGGVLYVPVSYFIFDVYAFSDITARLSEILFCRDKKEHDQTGTLTQNPRRPSGLIAQSHSTHIHAVREVFKV